MAKRKLSGALAWIMKEAKRLRREYPRRFEFWKEYVDQASAIYSSKHKGKSPVGHKHKKRSVMPKRKRRRVGAVRKKRKSSVIRKIKSFHAKEGRAIRSLGSVSHHTGKAREILEREIGHLEVKKFKAKKKLLKRRIGKHIAAKKAQYRKLC